MIAKKVMVFGLAFAAAASAFGDLSKYKDWAKSPEAYFLTPPEREQWATIKSDEDAEKFIQLYWAKREGGPSSKQEVMRRIEAADQQFKMRRYERGSQSTRGRLIVVLGPPDKQMRERAADAAGNAAGAGGAGSLSGAADITSSAANLTLTWIYEKNHFPADWGVPEVRAKILIDQARGSDELQVGAPVEKAIALVVEKSIVRPDGKTPVAAAAAPKAAAPAAAPAGAAPAPPASKPAASAPAASAAAPPAAAGAAIPAAPRAILDALGNDRKAPGGAFWGGTFRTLTGDPFYAFELEVPADKAAAGAKFGGVVTNEAGEEKGSFWEDANLTESKAGAATMKVFIRSVPLPPGSYRGTFGLFPADGSAALVSVTPDFKLEAKAAELEVSPLILTNLLAPLGKRALPAQPFIFGRPDKPIQIVPKGDKLYTTQDALWYFFTLTNPAKPAGAAPAAPAAAGAPPAADAPKPRLMATISVLRDGKPAYQPATAPIEPEPFGADSYGEGKEIPLAGFQPGYYSLVIKIRDLNAPSDSSVNKGVERRADFTVLKADGSLPDRAAPAPPPAAKAPAKKG